MYERIVWRIDISVLRVQRLIHMNEVFSSIFQPGNTQSFYRKYFHKKPTKIVIKLIQLLPERLPDAYCFWPCKTPQKWFTIGTYFSLSLALHVVSLGDVYEKKRQHNELWLFWRQRTARDFFNGLKLNFASPLFS